ncbi:MAG: VOC family protein [Haloferacaceae archaeon]
MDVHTLDHAVLYATDIDETCDFYERLGMERREFGDGRVALHFGEHKLNLHQAGDEYDPHARDPTPGAADFCLVTDDDVDDVAAELDDAGIDVVEGPVPRTGARGDLRSVYVYDPDGNLVEIAAYQ